jgi:dUTP pyrophosphatase
VRIKVINKSKHQFTVYSTTKAAGLDLSENHESNLDILQVDRVMVVANSFIEIPFGYELKIGPGNGLTIKQKVTGLNLAVIINADYHEEDYFLPVNLSNENFVIEDGAGICRMVMAKHEMTAWEHVNELLEYEIGCVGFRNTGKNNYENL